MQSTFATVHSASQVRKASCLTAVIGGAILMFFGTGCTVQERLTTVDNTFLEDVDINHKVENLPFDHAWVREDFDGRKFNKIYFKRISIDPLGKDGKWARSIGPLIKDYDEYRYEARQVANHFQEQILKEIPKYGENRLKIVDGPGPDVITVEIALTELEFSHPIPRAASLAAPIPGTGPALTAVTDPHMAFAARLYDPAGQLFATAADRKFPPTRIIDLNKLTVTSANREICNIWAETFAEAINKGRFSKTDRKGRFSILPW